jgi:hypothetical protein
MASHTIISPTSVDFKQLSAWGIESLNKARYSFDKWVHFSLAISLVVPLD